MAETFELVIRPAAIPMILVAATILLLGVVGAARERLSASTASFLLLTITASSWLFATAILIASSTEAAALIWSRMSYVGVCAIPAAVLQFALSLAHANDLRPSRNEIVIAWTHSAVFIALFTLTDVMLAPVYQYPWGYYTHLRPAGFIFLIFFSVALARAAAVLFVAWQNAPAGQQRNRLLAFLIALAIGYAGSVDFLPSFGIPLRPIGYLAILGFIGLAARAIVRFRLLDLDPAFIADHLLETMPGGVIVVDMRGNIRVTNPTAANLLGFARDELAGRNLIEVLHRRALPATESATFIRAGSVRNRTMLWTRRDGEQVELSVTATMLRDRDRTPIGLLYVLTDLEERRRAERHEFAANHDPLTGLPNRAYFANRFDTIAADIEERHRIPAVLFLDLDGFKDVNDVHGHAIGDRVLQLAATRLRNALREEDMLVRYGGDEFVVLVSVGRKEDVSIVSAKLAAVLQEPLAFDALTLHLGVSIGVAISPEDGHDRDTLIVAADAAMYREKQARRRDSPSTTPRAATVPSSIRASA